MFRLKLFGTPHLEGRAGVVQQGPRRLALLASLAAAGPGGLTRDKLVARLWPDADDDRARRNLSQLLYAMRTELGADLVEGTGTLRLDPAQCTADVTDFDAAIAEKRDLDALGIYGGAFLDGFHLAESAEFAQWADAERDRRAAQARAASLRLAESAAEPGERIAAWRRALGLDPLSAKAALRLMDALADEGDRSGAIRVAEQQAARVRAELDSDPDPEVQRRADALRRAPAREAAPAPVPASAPAAPIADAVSVARDAEPHHATASSPAAVTPRRRPAIAAVLLAVAAVVALGAWALRPAARLADDEFVLIAEFANHTGDSLLTRTIGTGVNAALQQSAHVVTLPRGRLAAALRRMQRPDTLERLDLATARDVAQREGIRFILTGEVIAAGTARQLVSQIVEASTGRIVATQTFDVAHDEEMLDAIDALARRMRRDLGEAAGTVREARSLPQETTRSLAALHAYAGGVDALRAGNSGLSLDHHRRAVALDSNFAAAHAKLGELYSLNNDIPRSSFHFGRALALAESLSVEERMRIKISAAWARGDRQATVSLSRSYLDLRPRDAGAWGRLAFALFSSGQQAEARAAYAKADSLSPLSPSSWLNVGTSWLSEARGEIGAPAFDSARVMYERAFALQPDLEYNTFYNHQYGIMLVGAGRPDSARATYDRMSRREALDRARGLRSNGHLDVYLGDWSTAAQRLAEATDLVEGARQWTSTVRNQALLAELHLLSGARDRALPPLRRAEAIAMREPLEARALAFIALAQVRAGDLAGARRILGRMRTMARVENDAEQAVLLAVQAGIDLAEGRTAPALAALRTGFVRDTGNPQVEALLARALEASGDDASALAQWEHLSSRFVFGLEGQFEWQFADYERGRLLERLGRTEQAEAAYRALVARYPTRRPDEPVVMREARARLERLEAGRR